MVYVPTPEEHETFTDFNDNDDANAATSTPWLRELSDNAAWLKAGGGLAFATRGGTSTNGLRRAAFSAVDCAWYACGSGGLDFLELTLDDGLAWTDLSASVATGKALADVAVLADGSVVAITGSRDVAKGTRSGYGVLSFATAANAYPRRRALPAPTTRQAPGSSSSRTETARAAWWSRPPRMAFSSGPSCSPRPGPATRERATRRSARAPGTRSRSSLTGLRRGSCASSPRLTARPSPRQRSTSRRSPRRGSSRATASPGPSTTRRAASGFSRSPRRRATSPRFGRAPTTGRPGPTFGRSRASTSRSKRRSSPGFVTTKGRLLGSKDRGATWKFVGAIAGTAGSFGARSSVDGSAAIVLNSGTKRAARYARFGSNSGTVL